MGGWVVQRRVPYSGDATVTGRDVLSEVRLELDGGALVFRDRAGLLVKAYGQGYWLTVEPEGEGA